MELAAKIYNATVLAVTVCVLLFIGVFTVPRLFSVVPFVVQSGSMEPAIPTGSVVFVDKNDHSLSVGDVVTFGLSTGVDQKSGKETGVHVTHRVSKVFPKEKLIQTKGDANKTPDGYLDMDAVIGKAVLRIPRVGFFLDYMQKHHGYILLIVLIAVLNASSTLFNQVAQRQARRGGGIRNQPGKKNKREGVCLWLGGRK